MADFEVMPVGTAKRLASPAPARVIRKARRMWVNQPSTHQPYHIFHGINVLLVDDQSNPDIMTCYYQEVGDMVSFLMSARDARYCLSPGWKGK